MEVEINGKKYHAATAEARVARCYVCEETVPKHRMVNIGPAKDVEGVYIFRCEDCYAGSPKWLKHFRHKSSLGSLYINVEKPDAEAQRALGKKIVDERRREVEEEICRKMDERKKRGGNCAAESPKVATSKKKGARSAVVVQRTRAKGVRSVKVSRTRYR